MPALHDTRRYHLNLPIDLLTEFTVCESLGHPCSPTLRALGMKRTYGAVLGDRLMEWGLLREGARLCEIGGGYGSLMRGLLEAHGDRVRQVVMVDLSRFLIGIQRSALEPWKDRVRFILGDALEVLPAITGVDLFVLNEMIGDLPIWTGLDPKRLPADAAALVDRHGLDVPEEGPFHFNIGAIGLVEALCRKGVSAFISEHASDPIIPPEMPFLERGLATGGWPREIRLTAHSEYTIRFSHLVQVARSLGRKVETGSLLELLGYSNVEKARFIFNARACSTDEQALIFEFLDHVREYRWLIIHGEG
ncbi:MAG: hypothetical protein A4E73_02238 [Syntrophaceae bacterium PtaU1.Bin231]|nr:MAG: hypothetical protein A4E73_02238 [Syntrophaceae bacterium PtaU1.Bin231]